MGVLVPDPGKEDRQESGLDRHPSHLPRVYLAAGR